MISTTAEQRADGNSTVTDCTEWWATTRKGFSCSSISRPAWWTEKKKKITFSETRSAIKRIQIASTFFVFRVGQTVVHARLVRCLTVYRDGRDEKAFPFVSLLVFLGLQRQFNEFRLLFFPRFSRRHQRSLQSIEFTGGREGRGIYKFVQILYICTIYNIEANYMRVLADRHFLYFGLHLWHPGRVYGR